MSPPGAPHVHVAPRLPPAEVNNAALALSVAERVLHQYAEASCGPPQPHRRRRRQQVPGGCERQTASHRVQLRGRQTHEASLALHSGDHTHQCTTRRPREEMEGSLQVCRSLSANVTWWT